MTKDYETKPIKFWRDCVKVVYFPDSKEYKLNFFKKRLLSDYVTKQKRWMASGKGGSICINKKSWKELFSKDGLVFQAMGDYLEQHK